MAEPYVIRDLSKKAADDASAAVMRAARLADTPQEKAQIATMATGAMLGMAAGFLSHSEREMTNEAVMVLALMIGRLTTGADDPREDAVEDYRAIEAAGRGVQGLSAVCSRPKAD